MNSRLLAYAQTFERDEQFKAEMNPNNSQSTTSVKDEFLRRNLFKSDGHCHEVESYLSHAEEHSGDQDNEKFKTARRCIIQHLEPQY
jgi:hypothetical protein